MTILSELAGWVRSGLRVGISRWWQELRPVITAVFSEHTSEVLAALRDDSLDVIAEIADVLVLGGVPVDQVEDMAVKMFREKMRERILSNKYDSIRDAVTDRLLNLARELYYGYYRAKTEV